MWPFGKKRTGSGSSKLVFSPEEFFENHCKYGHTEIRPTYGLVGFVEVGAADESTVDDKASRGTVLQTVTLSVASSDGGFKVVTQPMFDGPLLRKRDCVLWVPVEYDEKISTPSGDPRSAWKGVIVAKIAPEIDPTNSGSTILHSYAKSASVQ